MIVLGGLQQLLYINEFLNKHNICFDIEQAKHCI
jgi:hypothetical protein